MDVPIHLYKYRSLRRKKDKEHTSRILTHNEIYFAKCSEFNDPFDCRLHISVEGDFNTHKAKLRQLNPDLSEAEINNQTRKALQPKNTRKREQKVNSDIYRITKSAGGIFSMSAKRDDILMWSHYADYHKGICVEFKTSSGKLFGCELLKVEYEENYPKFSVYDDMNMERVRKYIGTKSSNWKYEEEWRMLYRETGCQRFPPEELSGVILGAHISKRNKELVYKWLSQNSCNVKLYEARECKDRFGLDIILIEQ